MPQKQSFVRGLTLMPNGLTPGQALVAPKTPPHLSKAFARTFDTRPQEQRVAPDPAAEPSMLISVDDFDPTEVEDGLAKGFATPEPGCAQCTRCQRWFGPADIRVAGSGNAANPNNAVRYCKRCDKIMLFGREPQPFVEKEVFNFAGDGRLVDARAAGITVADLVTSNATQRTGNKLVAKYGGADADRKREAQRSRSRR